MTQIVFMFSGQGSQYYGMAQRLYQGSSLFRETADRLDRLACELVGESVLGRLYHPQKSYSDTFARTLHTHPTLFIIQYALAQVLIGEGVEPDLTLGTSLGEFVAAAVACVMKPEDALEAVAVQARIIEERCAAGGMMAIFHRDDLVTRLPLFKDGIEVVAVNSDSHFVVAGSNPQLEKVAAFLTAQGIGFAPLPVSHAFHSALIDPAAATYCSYLYGKALAPPSIPFMSCLEGRVKDRVERDYFWAAVRRPMLFAAAIRNLEQRGAASYLDLGVGGTLAHLAARNFLESSRSHALAVITPFHQELKHLERIRAHVAAARTGAPPGRAGSGRHLAPEYIKTEEQPMTEKSRTMTACLFPGQGSQVKGMGEGLFDQFPELTAKADRILGYSIKTLCLQDPQRQLSQTQFTQPALYVVNALSYLNKVRETGFKPDYLAGHSLGEYNALFAAGAFDFETGLRLVQKRGELMSLATGGGMAAVIGLSEERVEGILRENRVDSIDIANYNSPSQIVLAGSKDEIERIAGLFELPGAMYIPLNVSGAFHSRHMEAAGREFGEFLAQFDFQQLTLRVISNFEARPYRQEQLKQTLVAQITHSVKWSETVRYLMGKGVEALEETGPGNVLTKLVQVIRKEAPPLVVAEEDVPSAPRAPRAEGEPAGKSGGNTLTPCTLGDRQFKEDYNLRYAYLVGSMYRGISSGAMLVQLARAGLMGFFGAGGLGLEEIEETLSFLRKELPNGEPYGANLLHNPADPEREDRKVDLFLKYGVRTIEASAYLSLTPALIRYRAQGLRVNPDGTVTGPNRIIAKVSRPEIAEAFLSPAPERLLAQMVRGNAITGEQAGLLSRIPVADDLCVEADSGGHTDAGVAYVLMPAMLGLRDDMMKKHGYRKRIRVGAAGGIGTPAAASAAFMLGADFIVTGSINQCTPEAATSELVKDLLQQMNVQDTEYAPAGDLFELGAKVQVLKKGLFFPARANRLYELYRQFDSLEQLDAKLTSQLEEKYFKRSLKEVYQDARRRFPATVIENAERHPKQKMALIFKMYFIESTQFALQGIKESKVDCQIQCGPALGSFNQWVKGTELEPWRNRNVDAIGIKLMTDTARMLQQRIGALTGLAA